MSNMVSRLPLPRGSDLGLEHYTWQIVLDVNRYTEKSTQRLYSTTQPVFGVVGDAKNIMFSFSPQTAKLIEQFQKLRRRKTEEDEQVGLVAIVTVWFDGVTRSNVREVRAVRLELNTMISTEEPLHETHHAFELTMRNGDTHFEVDDFGGSTVSFAPLAPLPVSEIGYELKVHGKLSADCMTFELGGPCAWYFLTECDDTPIIGQAEVERAFTLAFLTGYCPLGNEDRMTGRHIGGNEIALLSLAHSCVFCIVAFLPLRDIGTLRATCNASLGVITDDAWRHVALSRFPSCVAMRNYWQAKDEDINNIPWRDMIEQQVKLSSPSNRWRMHDPPLSDHHWILSLSSQGDSSVRIDRTIGNVAGTHITFNFSADVTEILRGRTVTKACITLWNPSSPQLAENFRELDATAVADVAQILNTETALHHTSTFEFDLFRKRKTWESLCAEKDEKPLVEDCLYFANGNGVLSTPAMSAQGNGAFYDREALAPIWLAGCQGLCVPTMDAHPQNDCDIKNSVAWLYISAQLSSDMTTFELGRNEVNWTMRVCPKSALRFYLK